MKSGRFRFNVAKPLARYDRFLRKLAEYVRIFYALNEWLSPPLKRGISIGRRCSYAGGRALLCQCPEHIKRLNRNLSKRSSAEIQSQDSICFFHPLLVFVSAAAGC